MGIIVFIAVILVIRLFFLQVIDPTYKEDATRNVLRKVIQYPSRGLIYDRNGKLLVFNKASYDLMVTPREMAHFDTSWLCSCLNVNIEEIRKNIREAKNYSLYKPSVIVRQIPHERFAFFQEQMYKMKGFYFQPRTIRDYSGAHAPHAIGYMGETTPEIIKTEPYYSMGDYIGITGIEKTYEEYLRGVKGVQYFLVDVHNRIQGSFRGGSMDTSSVAGLNLISSLDIDLQAYAETLMQNKKGSVVAIEPSSGEVLVLLSVPDYNPNLLVGTERTRNYSILVSDSLKPLFNRALMAQYPPGSTIKMAQALIGLQEGTLTTHTSYFCAAGYHSGNLTVGCHHNGQIGFLNSISMSCNAYYCYVFRSTLENSNHEGVREAYDAWRDYMLSFGFGRTLGTDFSNELKGLVPTSDYYERNVFKGSRWRALPIISLSIGQGELGITPLQMANYASILANRGYFFNPHVVKKIGDSDPDSKFSVPNLIKIDTAYYRDVIDGMKRAMEPGGTGAMSGIPGIQYCGKTGTAENPHGADHSVFMAFAPVDNPRIAISVYVENGVWGARYAAPIASLLIEKYLNDSIMTSRKWLEESMINANLLNPLQEK